VAALACAIELPGMSGAYNVCAPEAATNAEFMRALRHSVCRPWTPPAPAFVVRLVAKHVIETDPQLVLEGRGCAPTRLLNEGFQFEFPELAPALQDLAKWEAAPPAAIGGPA
jgi:NAD dependent epimerase/dehydratase family enzyme